MKVDKDKVIKKIQSLPNDYWIKRFKKLCDKREDRLVDLEAELLYLFALIREEVLDQTDLFLVKYDLKTQYDRLTRSELIEVKNYLSRVQDDMDKEGLEFDKDIAREIKNVSMSTKHIEALNIKVRAKLSYLYSVIGDRLNDHYGAVTEEFYYQTLYEIIKASGYDSDKNDDLEFLTLITVLSETYRPTGETFDDVIWRLGRTAQYDITNQFGKSVFSNLDNENIHDSIYKKFNSKYKELERNLETDTTYYSTLGQREAFTSIEIEEAVFTAILDERTSDFCREADGNIIPVEDIQPWVNSPPLHYYCRSTLVPVVKKVNWLTGDVEEVDGNFDGWYETHFGDKQ